MGECCLERSYASLKKYQLWGTQWFKLLRFLTFHSSEVVALLLITEIDMFSFQLVMYHLSISLWGCVYYKYIMTSPLLNSFLWLLCCRWMHQQGHNWWWSWRKLWAPSSNDLINSWTGPLLPNGVFGGIMLKYTIRNAIWVRLREVGMLIIT